MKIEVQRFQFDPEFTLGRMSVNGAFECYTCEDTVRPAGAPKVFGKTAIPAGSYAVIVDHSQHFDRDLPHVLNVPGFEGIRIHPGNTAKDTEGCILVGQIRQDRGVGSSVLAFNILLPKIQAALRAGEIVTLVIG